MALGRKGQKRDPGMVDGAHFVPTLIVSLLNHSHFDSVAPGQEASTHVEAHDLEQTKTFFEILRSWSLHLHTLQFLVSSKTSALFQVGTCGLASDLASKARFRPLEPLTDMTDMVMVLMVLIINPLSPNLDRRGRLPCLGVTLLWITHSVISAADCRATALPSTGLPVRQFL